MKTVLVSDDDRVLRFSEVIALVAGRDLKAVAAEIGADYTTLWRFMRRHGYEIKRELAARRVS